MHLIWFLVLLVCAAAYPLPTVLPSILADKELGGPANALETPLSIVPTRASRDGSEGSVPTEVWDVLYNALAKRAGAVQAPPTSTSLQVIIPQTTSRTYLSPLPTTTQPPSHTQPESTAEAHSSILAMPHTPGEASSLMATATATDDGGDGDGSDSGSDSGSDPSISTPTSADSSSPSKLATILGSVFGALIFIGMIIVFIVWWKRT